jgi:hypothetical protein
MAAIVLEPPKFTARVNPINNGSVIYYLDVTDDPGRIYQGEAQGGVITYGPGDTQPYKFFYENYIQNRIQGYLESRYSENQTQQQKDEVMVEYNKIIEMINTALHLEAASTLTTMAHGGRRRKSRRKSRRRQSRR